MWCLMWVFPTTGGELKEVNRDVFRFQVDYFTDLIAEVLPSGSVVNGIEDHTELFAKAHWNKERQLVLNHIDDQNTGDTLDTYG